MAKIFTYIMVILGILTLLNVAGVSTYSSQLLTAIGFDDPSGFDASGFFLLVLAIFASAATVGIVVGYLTSGSPESYIVAGIASALTIWMGSDLVGIYFTVANECPVGSGCGWIAKVFLILIIPLLGAFGISIIEWWRGSD